MKEFVLITRDEYISLLSLKTVQNNLPQNQNLDKNLNESLSTDISNISTREISNTNESVVEKPIVEPQRLCTLMNLNSRLKGAPKRFQPEDDTLADKTKMVAKTDKIVLDLLSSGLSGGKIERARQILRKIDQSNEVSIDRNSGRLILHDRDIGLQVFDFLNDLQVTTKNLSEGALDLVRRLKLPNFLLANTHAKRIATQNAQYDDKSEIDQEMETASTAKWLRLY